MKNRIIVATLLTIATLQADDIKTLNGTVYKNVTVSRVEPNGISIMHDDGSAKIKFAELPEELRTKYGYDPAKATQYSKAEQEAAVQRAAAAKAADISAISAATVSEKQKQLEKASKTLHISTEQVLAGGVLADRMKEDLVSYGRASGLASIGGGGGVSGGTAIVWRPSGTSIYISGLGKIPDGTELTIQAYQDGIYSDNGRTLEKWVFVKAIPN